MNSWHAGHDRHAKNSLTQTNHTRWCINTNRSPDYEHCDARNTERDEINKYMKKCIRLVINKNLFRRNFLKTNLLHISIPTWSLASSFQSYCLFTNNRCPSVDSEKFCLSDLNSKFRIIAMSEIVDFQILFYTQCVIIVIIRLHIALRVLSSNHSLRTVTVVKRIFTLEPFSFPIFCKNVTFNPNVSPPHPKYIIMQLFMVLKEVAVVLLLFQKLAPLRCCHYWLQET